MGGHSVKSKVKQIRRRKKKHMNVSIKFVIAVCACLFYTLMVVGTTYAWFTSEDSKRNNFLGSSLSAEIVEEFEPEFEWQPGLTTKKVIQVKNTGDVSAFVRISLYEYLLTFKVDTTDQTGNGNLATSLKEVLPVVDQKKTESWQPAALAGGTYAHENQNYIAQKAIVPNILTGTEMYKFKDSSGQQPDLRWFQLTFSDNVYDSAPPLGTKKYWLYQDGYFYYSELLKSNEVSVPLVKNVRLRLGAPNKYKGSLYQLNPVMNAHDGTKELLSAWNIGTSGKIYTLYQDQLSD